MGISFTPEVKRSLEFPLVQHLSPSVLTWVGLVSTGTAGLTRAVFTITPHQSTLSMVLEKVWLLSPRKVLKMYGGVIVCVQIIFSQVCEILAWTCLFLTLRQGCPQLTPSKYHRVLTGLQLVDIA